LFVLHAGPPPRADQARDAGMAPWHYLKAIVIAVSCGG